MLEVAEGLYLRLTPTGAFRGAVGSTATGADRLVSALLRRSSTPPATTDTVLELTGIRLGPQATSVLLEAQEAGLIEGVDHVISAPEAPAAELAERTLGELSDSGRGMLATSDGSVLASVGFTPERADHLAALAAALDEIRGLTDLRPDDAAELGLAFVDRLGVTTLGSWPLRFGDRRLHLVVGGLPHFNRPELTELLWGLAQPLDQPPTPAPRRRREPRRLGPLPSAV